MHKSIWIYPWTFKDEGIDKVMETISEVGLNAISVATSYHAGKFISPHNPKGKVYFPEDGVIYFRPDLSLYKNTKIKPHISSIVREIDLFKTIAVRARHYGLNLVAWTVGLHNSRIGQKYPDCTVKNAFGDSYIHSLCPSNKDVREYLKSLVRDIASNHDVYSVELESPGFMAFEHGFHHEMYGIDLTFLQSFLLSLCFCKHCIYLAKNKGIDIDKVRKEVKDILNTSLNSNVPLAKNSRWAQSLELIGMLIDEREFYKYLAFRKFIVIGLIKEIKAVLTPDTKLFLISTSPSSFSWSDGSSIREVANIVDAIETTSYFKEPEDVYLDVCFAKRMIGLKSKLYVGLRPCFPDVLYSENLTKKLKILNKVGIDGVSFYNYSHMPHENLEWIKMSLNILENPSS